MNFLKRAWCVILHHHEELWSYEESRGYHVMCPSCGFRSPGWNKP